MQLPTLPVAMSLVGKLAAPAAIEVVDWQDATFGQHELHFFAAKPAHACAFDLIDDGIKVGLPAIQPGKTRTDITTVSRTGAPFATAMWKDTGNVLGMEGGGWLAIELDTATDREVRGRVVAWFNDPAKSMIAGAFTATRCHITP